MFTPNSASTSAEPVRLVMLRLPCFATLAPAAAATIAAVSDGQVVVYQADVDPLSFPAEVSEIGINSAMLSPGVVEAAVSSKCRTRSYEEELTC